MGSAVAVDTQREAFNLRRVSRAAIGWAEIKNDWIAILRTALFAALTLAGCGPSEPDFHRGPVREETAEDRAEACRGGDQAACLALAGGAAGCNQLALAREASDPALALQLYLTACDHGVLAGCTNAADPMRAIDLPRATRLAQRGCDGRDGMGCHNLGVILQDTGRMDEAVASYRRGCDLGVAMSCDSVGALGLAGLVSIDAEEITTMLGRACDGGDGRGCANLGRHLIRALDPPAGRAAFARACELGHAVACHDLALALGRGEGGAADPAGALEAAQRGCALGSTEACSLLTVR